MKNIKSTISAVILLTLAFFIFFSKSVYTFNIPEVTGTMPVNGKLNKKETVSGVVEWLNISELYAELGGKIEEIYVSEGETVEEGQALVSFNFDEDDVISRLKELEISKSKLLIEIENLNIRLSRIHRNIEELKNEIYTKDEVSRYELTQLEKTINNKQAEYEKNKILYNAGAVSKQTLEAAETELESLFAQYENMIATIKEQEIKALQSISDKEDARQKQLLEYNNDITSINQDLKAKALDFKNLEFQEENYRKTLAKYENSSVIYSSEACTVTSVNIKKGQYINANTHLMSFGLGNTYKIECSVRYDNDFISVGDECEMYNSLYTHYFYGVVSKITPQSSSKLITVTINSEELTVGETFDMIFEKESVQRGTLIPNGAIHQDSNGYFIYKIKRRDGILGKEYYAEKVQVFIGDSDNENTMITGGITFFDPVILLSNKTFSENDTIKINNEGDFFAGD